MHHMVQGFTAQHLLLILRVTVLYFFICDPAPLPSPVVPWFLWADPTLGSKARHWLRLG